MMLPRTLVSAALNSCSPAAFHLGTGWFLGLLLLTVPSAAFAHAGHSHEFQGANAATQPPGAIAVDAMTAQRMGMKVEPIKAQRLAIAVKTTGQIESLPNQKVNVRAPVSGTLVELLVKPGDRVSKSQPVAVLSSSELAQLRVESLSKRAEAIADLQQAQADLKLAQENYQRQVKIAEAEVAQANTQLSAAQKQYERDRELVEQKSVVKVAKENYQRQNEIADAEIAQAETELAVAQEQYERDRDLLEKGAIARRTFLESQAHLAQAKAQLARANQRQNVLQAESDMRRAEVDLPLRNLRESQGQLAEAQAQLTKALSRREVLEAEAQIKRAQASLEVAQSRLGLAGAAYQARLQQLGAIANDRGLVTVLAPISGTVAEREITLGESVQAAEKSLMTLLNDSRVFASANIYEKDLHQIQQGQEVRVKVAATNRFFTGRITFIGSVVAGETRVIPVKAELDNSEGNLKPGMFAELEILTSRTASLIVAIPTSALVEANGKQLVYVQNGNTFQPVEVAIGQTSGDLVEVKGGLFEGDSIVTQRAPQLYAQSLRSGNSGEKAESKAVEKAVNRSLFSFPEWWLIPAGGAVAVGAFWLGRRTQTRTHLPLSPAPNAPVYDLEAYLNNTKQGAVYHDREEA
ncbi:MAG: efflux RND transporter periplasmic adaptor subunit [Actinomycetota bacterium]